MQRAQQRFRHSREQHMASLGRVARLTSLGQSSEIWPRFKLVGLKN